MTKEIREAAERAKAAQKSSHKYNEGDKVQFEVVNFKYITSFDNMYGTTHLYKFEDKEGNVYSWFASSGCDEEKVKSMFIETHDDKNKESMLINLARVDLVCKDSKTGKAIVYFANSDIKCCLDESFEAVMSIITRLQNHTLDASYSSYKYCI